MAEANGANGVAPDKMRYSSLPASHKVLRKRLQESQARPCSFWARALGITVLVVLLALGSAMCFIMWGTDSFENAFLKELVLRNNTQMYDWWREPPVIPFIKVRFFNYTNYEDIIENGAKPQVTEVGPYTFEQKMEKVFIKFSDNGTVTFNEKITFTYVPDLSSGSESDFVIQPNVPFLSAVSVLRDADVLKRMAMSIALKSVNPPAFLRFSVKDFLWGYKETLTQLAKAFSIVDIDPESFKLGVLEARAGILRDAVSVETGERDIDRLGLIVDVGGRRRLDAWGDTECSLIDGSDGTLFPPRLVQRRQRLNIFNKDMCRRLPLEFSGTTVVGGLEALVYTPPANVFGTPEKNPENKCFCPPSPDPEEPSCPFSGVFSVGPCNFDAPVLVSFPHFFGGDPQLRSFVDGLKPDKSKHSMYLNIHPVLGVPMGGITRFQMNIKIRKSTSISSIDFLDDGMILPVAWMEIGVEELPQIVIKSLSKASIAEHIKNSLLYGSIVVIVITSSLLLMCAYKCWTRRYTVRNVQDSHVLEPL